jgi:cellobiose phosphorylase
MDNKRYGHFDDAHREYVITDPQTPWPWINYLGNEDFFSLISNTAGGYSFYKDAKFRRITRYRYNDVPMDNNGRYFYIKDGDTVWNPGWKPCRTPLDSYECRHGMNYTRITGSKLGVVASVLFFVPLHTAAEVQDAVLWRTTAANSSISRSSPLRSGVCGTLPRTWRTSSATSRPARWR